MVLFHNLQLDLIIRGFAFGVVAGLVILGVHVDVGPWGRSGCAESVSVLSWRRAPRFGVYRRTGVLGLASARTVVSGEGEASNSGLWKSAAVRRCEMKRKYLMTVLLAVAFFAVIAVVRAEQKQKIRMVRINPDEFIANRNITVPSGRVLGLSCTIEGPSEMCYLLVEVRK